MRREPSARARWSLIAAVGTLGVLFVLSAIRPPGPDVREYAAYAAQALARPLAAWPREYPPLALGVFLLPRLLPFPYPVAFAVLAALAYGSLVALAAEPLASQADWRFRLLTYTLYGVAFVVLRRYDIFAVLPATAGVLAARRGLWARAWALTVVGAWLKVYPVVFWPVFLASEWARSRRVRVDRLAVALAAGAAPTVLAALVSGPAAWSWINYLRDRPPNLGSFAGDLAAVVTGDWHYRFAYGSLVVTAPGAGPLSLALTAAGLVALGLITLRAAQGRWTVERAALGAVLVLILMSKVFSVQYLLWVIPLFALVGPDPVWLVAAFLVNWEYPLAYVAALGPEVLRLRALWGLLANAGLLASLLRVGRPARFVRAGVAPHSSPP
jgi:hypothetical protein